MHMRHSLPAFAVLILVAVVGGAAPFKSASAIAVYAGSVHIHTHLCQMDSVAPSVDCTYGPASTGVAFTVDSRTPKPVDEAGNVSFGQVMAGSHTLSLIVAKGSERLDHAEASCSNSALGLYASKATFDSEGVPDVTMRVLPRSRLTCEVYLFQ